MKSPNELKQRLRRQWEHAGTREFRLLGGADVWPLVLSIGKPKPSVVQDELDQVKRHVEAWRRVSVGEVVWEAAKYRATDGPVDVPIQWKLCKPSDWVAACADSTMRAEFESLSSLVSESDSLFHTILVRRRSLWRDKPIDEVKQAARLALTLEPGCASGRPLRTISLEGIDTKFFERNSNLITTLLDARFDSEVSRLGLEVFLDAFLMGDHWLLVMDLDGKLLPFRKQRVASTDLGSVSLPCKRLLIVENDACQHQLPQLPKTIAVLGAGFDLNWTKSELLQDKEIGYWGDIDTWGLQFLANVRRNIQNVVPILMTTEVFRANRNAAVPEPVVAGTECPFGLTVVEQHLYRQLLAESNGRLEQEFLPQSVILECLLEWAAL